MKWQAYPKYKDSDVEWLGKIPEEWEINRIKHTTYVKGRIGWKGLKSDEFIDEGPYLLTGTDFDKGRINWHRSYHVSEERYKEDPYIQLKENDLLITKDGTIGKVAIVKNLPGKACLNSGIFVTRPTKKEYITSYMYWLLNSEVFSRFIDYTKTGTTISHLYQNVFVEFAFPRPSITEQHTIAAFLDRETSRIDKLISKKERQIELLQEKRAALISHAVTKGLDPNARMKDSCVEWLGKIPEHWNVKRLKYLLAAPFQYGANEAAELEDINLPRYVRITDINEDGTLKEDTFKSLSEDVAKPYLLNNDDILFARSGATVGKTFLYQEPWGKAAYAGYLIRARVNKKIIKPEYVAYFCHSTNYWDWLHSNFIQSTIQNVSAEKYAVLIIGVPSIEEQEITVKFLDEEAGKINKIISKVTQSISTLREYRTALISAAVTGKIDVRKEEISK